MTVAVTVRNMDTEEAAEPEEAESDALSEREKQLIEWYKAEYKLAYDRYENIYKSIWSIFPFMSAMTGAVLVFGAAKPAEISLAGAGALALLPLGFWYLATYKPLNRYGDEVQDRLTEIERRVAPLLRMRGTLGHFNRFAARREWYNRVRGRVGVAFCAVLGTWVACLVNWLGFWLFKGDYHTHGVIIGFAAGLIALAQVIPEKWLKDQWEGNIEGAEEPPALQPDPPPPSPKIAGEIQVALEAIACALPRQKDAVYLSSPITSGRLAAVWLATNGRVQTTDTGLVTGHTYDKGRFNEEVIQPNCALAEEVAVKARERLQKQLIVPANLTFDSWSQADYYSFWEKVLGRYATRVVFVNGWEFSSGCVGEFCIAQESGLPCETESGGSITREEGLKMLEVAIEFLRQQRAVTTSLEYARVRLNKLAHDQRGG